MPISTFIKVSTSRIVIVSHPLARERIEPPPPLYSTRFSVPYFSLFVKRQFDFFREPLDISVLMWYNIKRKGTAQATGLGGSPSFVKLKI